MYEIPFTEKCAIASLHLINTACRVLVVLLTTFRLKTANRRDSIVECSAPWHGLPVRIGNHFEVNCQFHQVKGSSLWGYCFRSVECLLITRGSMWFGCSCFFLSSYDALMGKWPSMWCPSCARHCLPPDGGCDLSTWAFAYGLKLQKPTAEFVMDPLEEVRQRNASFNECYSGHKALKALHTQWWTTYTPFFTATENCM